MKELKVGDIIKFKDALNVVWKAIIININDYRPLDAKYCVEIESLPNEEFFIGDNNIINEN